MAKTLYVVQYNDCYGNGNKTLETIVESYEHFLHWLKEHNEAKGLDYLDDSDFVGDTEEGLDYLNDSDFVGDMEEEFDLIPLNLASPIIN